MFNNGVTLCIVAGMNAFFSGMLAIALLGLAWNILALAGSLLGVALPAFDPGY